MKDLILVISGAIGAAIGHFFGAWDALIEAMFVFMVIDIVTGIMVAAWFSKSDKSHDGKLWSKAMWRGMAKKGVAIFFVVVGVQFDLILERDYVRSAIIFCVLASELLSIIENAGLMGVPIPEVLRKMLTVLNEKAADKVADKFADDVINKMENDNANKSE